MLPANCERGALTIIRMAIYEKHITMWLGGLYDTLPILHWQTGFLAWFVSVGVGLFVCVCISHTQISEHLAGRSGGTLHASLEHLEVEYHESEKKSSLFRTLSFWYFLSDSRYYTSKCSNMACTVNRPFSSRHSHTAPGRKKSDLQDSATFSGSWYSTSKCYDLACNENQPLVSRHSQTMPGWKKSRHLTCQFGALEVKYGEYESVQILRSSGMYQVHQIYF
jgi:hypothetical protein